MVYKGSETDGWPPGLTNQNRQRVFTNQRPSVCLERDGARRIRVALKGLKSILSDHKLCCAFLAVLESWQKLRSDCSCFNECCHACRMCVVAVKPTESIHHCTGQMRVLQHHPDLKICRRVFLDGWLSQWDDYCIFLLR